MNIVKPQFGYSFYVDSQRRQQVQQPEAVGKQVAEGLGRLLKQAPEVVAPEAPAAFVLDHPQYTIGCFLSAVERCTKAVFDKLSQGKEVFRTVATHHDAPEAIAEERAELEDKYVDDSHVWGVMRDQGFVPPDFTPAGFTGYVVRGNGTVETIRYDDMD